MLDYYRKGKNEKFISKIIVISLTVIMLLPVGMNAGAVFADSYDQRIVTFVTSLYTDCLGRQPDSVGLNDWCGRLTRGEISGKQCAYGFFYSPEFLSTANRITDSELVEAYYRVFLNRPSDPAGKAYWIGQIANTTNDVSILFTGFADSAEFAQKCSSYGIVVGSHINVGETVRGSVVQTTVVPGSSAHPVTEQSLAAANSRHNYYRGLTAQQAAQADAVCRDIANQVLAMEYDPSLCIVEVRSTLPDGTITASAVPGTPETVGIDMFRVQMAARLAMERLPVSRINNYGNDANGYYRSPYGVFITGNYTCSGDTRALGRVLDFLGYDWTHAFEGQNHHQWLELTLDGRQAWADLEQILPKVYYGECTYYSDFYS